MGFFDKLFSTDKIVICAPVNGEAVPVTEVSDPTFGEEILGKGIAIKPEDGQICAPCDGTIELMFETGHAVSMTGDNGAEILVHVGLETVKLAGKHFTVHAKSGDRVKAGQVLITCDIAAIAAEGYDTITPVVICNSADFAGFTAVTGKTVAVGDPVITLRK